MRIAAYCTWAKGLSHAIFQCQDHFQCSASLLVCFSRSFPSVCFVGTCLWSIYLFSSYLYTSYTLKRGGECRLQTSWVRKVCATESLELSSLALTMSLSKPRFNLTKDRVIPVVHEVRIPSSVYICHQGQSLKSILSGHYQQFSSWVL